MKTDDVTRWPLLGTWQVPADHPVLAGHFPGHPVVPGALLLDWVLGLMTLPSDAIASVREVRFHLAARPGVRLMAHGITDAGRARFAIVDADGQHMCSGALDFGAGG